MSVEDVCELGSLLQSGDQEKSLLERKLIELDGAIQTQDRRLNHEVEAEQWARSEQNNLLEHATNSGNNFEIASSVISQLRDDTLSAKHLSNILDRVKAYINLRDDLADDITSVQNEIKRLQDASIKVDDTHRQKIANEITVIQSQVSDKTTEEQDLKHSLKDIKDDIDKRKIVIAEKLIATTFDIEKLVPKIERSRQLVDNKVEDLLKKTVAARLEADTVLNSLREEQSSSSSSRNELGLLRDSIAEQCVVDLSGIAIGQESLTSSLDENMLLLGNFNSSSDAELTTAREVEDAKKQLAELKKFSSDCTHELNRMIKAQSFEKAREDAFVKSQGGNNLSAQQMSGEADRLRASLELVREEIAQIKNQITHELSDSPVELNYVPHEKLEQLNILKRSYRTRKSTAQGALVTHVQQKAALEERRRSKINEKEALKEKMDASLNAEGELLNQQEGTRGRLEVLSQEISACSSLHSIQEASSLLTSELVEIRNELIATKKEELDTQMQSTAVKALSVSNLEQIEAYDLLKQSQYELAEKDHRLRASRQEKLNSSGRALTLLQGELQREDDRFKDAVKAAEDNAKATEEKVVAAMNQVIEVGLQMIAERNSRNKEVEELEVTLRILDEEYKEKSDILANMHVTEHPVPLAIVQRSRTSPSRINSLRAVEEPRNGRANDIGGQGTKRSQNETNEEDHPSPPHSQRRKSLNSSWGSSSPAAIAIHSVKEIEHNDMNRDEAPLAQSQTRGRGIGKSNGGSKGEGVRGNNFPFSHESNNENINPVKEIVQSSEGDQESREAGSKAQPIGARMRGAAAQTVRQKSTADKASELNIARNLPTMKHKTAQATNGAKRSRSAGSAK